MPLERREFRSEMIRTSRTYPEQGENPELGIRGWTEDSYTGKTDKGGGGLPCQQQRKSPPGPEAECGQLTAYRIPCGHHAPRDSDYQWAP